MNKLIPLLLMVLLITGCNLIEVFKPSESQDRINADEVIGDPENCFKWAWNSTTKTWENISCVELAKLPK